MGGGSKGVRHDVTSVHGFGKGGQIEFRSIKIPSVFWSRYTYNGLDGVKTIC